MEVYVLVNKKKSVFMYVLDALVLVGAVACLLVGCFFPPLVIATIFLGILFYFTHFATNVEYEYSYFGGEVKVAKITNKSRRKRLMLLSMEEVIQIAPHNDRSVYKYENDKSVIVKDYTSHDKKTDFYELIANKDGKMYLVMFEPDEAFLNEICVRYGMKVIKRPVEG